MEILDLRGKVALVTGSARGLGQEIAKDLAGYGVSLILADVEYPEETEKESEKGCRSETPTNVLSACELESHVRRRFAAPRADRPRRALFRRREGGRPRLPGHRFAAPRTTTRLARELGEDVREARSRGTPPVTRTDGSDAPRGPR